MTTFFSADAELQCQICHLWFEEEFGLANHYSREHFDRIRSAEDEPTEEASAAAASREGAKTGSEKTVTIRNLDDDMKADDMEAKHKVKIEEETEAKPEEEEEESRAEKPEGDASSTSASTATSDTTPRRSSRRHALKNANPQQVRQHSEEEDRPRAPSCSIDNSREDISKIASKRDGNETAIPNGSQKTTTTTTPGRVTKRDSEEVKDEDDAAGTPSAGRGVKRRASEEMPDDDGLEVEPDEKGGVKEEGRRSIEEEDSVEISQAKKGGLQCPLCPTSCNYRSLLLNHIKKFHPGWL